MRPALLVLAVACLSQPANLIRLAAAPIETIGFWRLALAAAALAPFAWRSRASWAALPGRDRLLAGAAGLLFFAHLWTFVYAAQNTSVADCMVLFSTHPLWTGAGAWLFFGTAPTARLAAAYVLASAGVWALVSGAGGRAGLDGDLAALASAALFSAYVLAGRRVRARLDNPVYAGVVYAVTAGGFLAAALAKGVPLGGQPGAFWAAVAGLAFGVTLGGHALFTYLLAHMDVNLLSCAKLLEPLGGALGASLLFGEPLTVRAAAAFALVGGGVLVLLWPAGRSAPAEPGELED